MKKILALILALAMVFALAACGRSSVNGDVTSVEKPADEQPAGTVTTAEEPAETESAETSAEAEAAEAPAEVETETGEAAQEGAGDAAGEVTEEGAGDAVGGMDGDEPAAEEAEQTAGTRYENESLGIGLVLDETWTIYNDEQLAELSGLTADMFSDEKYKEMMENSNSFTDFFAQHSSGASINVMFENLGLLYGSVMSEEQYRTAALQNLSGAYESAGFENVEIVENTVDFAGTERARSTASTTTSSRSSSRPAATWASSPCAALCRTTRR